MNSFAFITEKSDEGFTLFEIHKSEWPKKRATKALTKLMFASDMIIELDRPPKTWVNHKVYDLAGTVLKDRNRFFGQHTVTVAYRPVRVVFRVDLFNDQQLKVVPKFSLHFVEEQRKQDSV